MIEQQHVDAVVVGAGFGGLYQLKRLRELGLTTRVFEAGSGVGGTWYWNRYPGARCDVPSVEYSYSFDDDLQQEWDWTERYATQPEILSYLDHVADRFDLREDITFDTRVTSAAFDEDADRWTITTDGGEEVTAQFFVMATGCLSNANMPDIEGRDSFAGPTYHTGQWPHEGVDFTGLRVGIIGTGSSAVQSIPMIAEQADHLTVFQRTPTYAVPAHNRPLEDEELAYVKAHYDELRDANREMGTAFGGWLEHNDIGVLEVDEATREAQFDKRWEEGGLAFLGAFNDLLLVPEANEIVADYVRRRIAEKVDDPDVAAKLMPDTVVGCKRLCVDTGYYETYNRPNVSLIDLQDTPIQRITPTGIDTAGDSFEFDAIVFATGFDAMTGALLAVDIEGRQGRSLREVWSAGPTTYLGVQVPEFPNLFIISGPGSPSVLTNMVTSIEQHVEFIADTIEHVRATGHTTIEPEPAKADEWVAYVNTVADFTLFPRCNSWYLGANVPGKPRVFMPLPGFPGYVEQVDQIVDNDYEGFILA